MISADPKVRWRAVDVTPVAENDPANSRGDVVLLRNFQNACRRHGADALKQIPRAGFVDDVENQAFGVSQSARQAGATRRMARAAR